MKMKNRIWSSFLIMMGLMAFSPCCKKENEQVQVQPPVLKTNNVDSITPNAANCGGYVASEGGAAVTAKGVCWSTNQNPTISDFKTYDGIGPGIFKSQITGLTATTTYYVKAYATNILTTSYGDEMRFKTFTDTVHDVDDNVYNTMLIGTQTWMAENLKVTKFNDKSPIPLVTKNTEWAAATKPCYCWYNNDAAAYKVTYGALYNWYVVDSGSNGDKNICPTGWHVPTDEEWTILTTFLGGEDNAGGKMKETGTVHWQSPNTGASNESGFTGYPGGGRYFDGTFSSLGCIGCWWSSTELSTYIYNGRGRYLYHDLSLVYSGSGNKRDGFSIRCVKD
jgi:uncharacterized protein (TIGR02145 family)